MKILLVILACVPVAVYLGYPLVLLAVRAGRHRREIAAARPCRLPLVTLLITARNEEREIAGRVRNALRMDYPRDRLEILVASDASDDATDAVVESFATQGVHLIRGPGLGKSSAQNAAFPHATGEIVVLTDADTRFRPDALMRLIAPFADPRIGCTVGRVCYRRAGCTPTAGAEGIYWAYETWLRSLESDAGILSMGSGAIMALRRHLLAPLDRDESDDFALPLRVVAAGLHVRDVPAAVTEGPVYQDRPRPMYASRVRIVSKDCRTLVMEAVAGRLWRRPLVLAGLLVHKALRWVLALDVAALLAVSLALSSREPLARISLVTLAVAFALGLWGGLGQLGLPAMRVANGAFHFFLIHAAAVHGVIRAALGKKSGRWLPVRELENPLTDDAGDGTRESDRVCAISGGG